MSLFDHVLHFFRGTRSAETGPKMPTNVSPEVHLQQDPDLPQGFGYKTCWLAIHTHDVEAVVKHLHLTNIRKANWHTGLQAAYSSQHDVFVSPSVQGWIFVVGCAFPDIGHGSSPCEFTRFLQHIGAHFEDVQYFGTHRVVEYQAWA
jgi:hypothetical protein